MSKDDHESFLGRWSRRKLAPAAGRTEEPEAAPGDGTDSTVAANDTAFGDFDFASLDFSSDYRRFMAGTVPDHVRTRALQRLWTSSDLIAEPDELDEFLEDFRDQAKAVPSALARSAYRIGRGFVDDEPETTPQDGDAAADNTVRDDGADISGAHAMSGSGENTGSDRSSADREAAGDTGESSAAASPGRRQSARG